MYLRLFKIKVKTEFVSRYIDFYKNKVIQKLNKVSGCLFAGLLINQAYKNRFISMTFWNSPQNAGTYEKSNLYKLLLKENKPFLAESSEWNIQLSDDLNIQYEPVPEEPSVTKYSVKVLSDSHPLIPAELPEMHVRILSIKIQQEKMQELENTYKKQIIPALKNVDGCRFAFLTESMSDNDEVLSITVWNNSTDADNYEKSGRFKTLLSKLEHTFPPLYHWKKTIEAKKEGQVFTSADLSLEQYIMLTGKQFQ